MAVPVALLKLSFADVSVKVKPDKVARLGVSSAPLMLAVNVCEALVLPSVTARVKLSEVLDFSASMALSSGT